MTNKSTLENHFGKIKKSRFEELATQWEAEKTWKQNSQHIAIELSEFLDDNNLTQKAFAEQMGLSPQVINKWLKGQENFTLETIGKLEAVMKRSLIEVVNSGVSTEVRMEEIVIKKFEYVKPLEPQNANFKTAKLIIMSKAYNNKCKGY